MALDREATLDRNATIGLSKTGNGDAGTKNSASVHFGRLVAARRLEIGLSQEELAERMGSSQSRVARIEAGEPISPATRESLTDALDMEQEPNPLRRLITRAGGSGALIPVEPIGRRITGGLSATRGALERPAAALDFDRARAALGQVPKRARTFDGLERARGALSRIPKPALADGARIPVRAALGLVAAAVIAFLLSLIVVDATWARIGLTVVTVAALWLSMVLVQRRADARLPVAIAAAIWLSAIAIGLISNGGSAEGSSNGPATANATTSAATAAPEAATLAQNGAAAAILGSDAAAASRVTPKPAKSKSHDASTSDTTVVPTDQPIPSSVAPSSSPSSSGGKPGAKPGSLSDNNGGGSSGSNSSSGSTGTQSGSSSGSSPVGNIVNSLGNAHQRP